MALVKNTYVLGTHVYCFLDGAAFSVPSPGGVAGRNTLPGATDPAWYDLGIIESAEDNLQDTEIEVWSPTPGKLRLYDTIGVKEKLTIKFTTQELSPVAIQAVFRTLPLTETSTQFNPLSGQTVKAWLQIQRYDQTDTQRMILDFYCRLKVANAIKADGGALSSVEFEALGLYSSLNSGSL